jgi:hypothetical protein
VRSKAFRIVLRLLAAGCVASEVKRTRRGLEHVRCVHGGLDRFNKRLSFFTEVCYYFSYSRCTSVGVLISGQKLHA